MTKAEILERLERIAELLICGDATAAALKLGQTQARVAIDVERMRDPSSFAAQLAEEAEHQGWSETTEGRAWVESMRKGPAPPYAPML